MSQTTSTHFAKIHASLLLAMSLDPQEIGQRIKVARERKGWTQLQFALEAHVSPSSVARWEAGHLPPIRELIRLSAILKILPEELVDRPALATDSDLIRLEQILEVVLELRGEVQDLAQQVRELREDRPPQGPDTNP